jgi:short-subunit dehydrogenase
MRYTENDTYIIITGSSQGLGKAMAKQFASCGYNLILLALPNEELPSYCQELSYEYRIQALCYETDLTELDNIYAFSDWVKNKNLKITGLVNNAGLGGSDYFDETNAGFIDTLILLNIRALALLTRLFVPELKQRKEAFVLNISSMAAFKPIPYKTVYPASKAFVFSFSIGLREELKNTSIKVSVMHPGPMHTNSENSQRLHNQGFLGKMIMLDVDEAAKIGVSQTLAGRKIIIPGFVNKVSCRLMKMMPSFMAMPIFSKILQKDLALRSKMQKT